MDSIEIVVPLLIDGGDITTTSAYDVISPFTNKVCWKAVSASTRDAIAAVKAAEDAFPKWSATKPYFRRDLLLKVATILEARTEEYAGYMSMEMGADMDTSVHIVLPTAIRMLRDIACRISSICAKVPVCENEGQSAIVFKEPYGVILGLVPWNAPYVFGIRSAATAIATGNTTVLKASEFSPRSYHALGRAFCEAGLPSGVLNVISCPPEVSSEIFGAMVSHPAVMKINFTGSSAVGAKIAEQCGRHLKPCLMELGGKNSAIVLDDADVAKAVKECMIGSFALSGQICMSTDRIIIQSAIATPFLDSLEAALQSQFSSNSPSISPTLISTASKTRVDSLVSDAISSGAHVLFSQGATSNTDDGVRFGFTVLGGMTRSMRIWREEAFAPIVGYMIVESEDEAIAAANDTDYGLSASVFTKDLRRGLSIAQKIRSGAVHINSMTFHDEASLAFGGVKHSGWGRFNSNNGMEEFLVTKAVTWDD